MYIKTDEGLGQAPMLYGSIAGVLGDDLPKSPVDSSAVTGCETAARPFDDFAFKSADVPVKAQTPNQGAGSNHRQFVGDQSQWCDPYRMPRRPY